MKCSRTGRRWSRPRLLLALAGMIATACQSATTDRTDLPPSQETSDKPKLLTPADGAREAVRGFANCYAPRFVWAAAEPPRRPDRFGPVGLNPSKQTFFICVKEGTQRCDVDGWSARQPLHPLALGNTVAPHLMWRVLRSDGANLTISQPPGGTGTATFEYAEQTLKPVNSALVNKDGLVWTASSCFPDKFGALVCVEAKPNGIGFARLVGSEAVECVP